MVQTAPSTVGGRLVKRESGAGAVNDVDVFVVANVSRSKFFMACFPGRFWRVSRDDFGVFPW